MKRFLSLMMAVVAVSVPGWTAHAAAQAAKPGTMPGQSASKGAPAPRAAKTVSGVVKGSKAADSLTVNTDDGKDWKFVIDSSTKVSGKEGSRAGGPDGKQSPGETGRVGPQAVTKGAAKAAVAERKLSVADLGMGDLVSVTYDEVGGTMHAASVRVTTKYVDRFR